MWLLGLNKRVTRNPSLREIPFKTFWQRMICNPHPPACLYPDPEQLHGRHLLCIFSQCQVLVAQLDQFLDMSSALLMCLRSISVSSVVVWCNWGLYANTVFPEESVSLQICLLYHSQCIQCRWDYLNKVAVSFPVSLLVGAWIPALFMLNCELKLQSVEFPSSGLGLA